MINNLPHICIDATCIVSDTKGASVYAISLLRELHALTLDARLTILMREEVAGIKSLNFLSNKNWSVKEVRVKSSHLWHLLTLPQILAHIKPDLLFVLGETLLGWLPIPYILTVHELPHIYNKLVRRRQQSLHHYLSQLFTQILFPSTCSRAAHLLTVSKNTAIDIEREFDISSEKISVTYEAADSRFFQASQLVSDWCTNIPRPYILIFATGDNREVPEQVVQAFSTILQTSHSIPHYLVIAGRCPDWQKLTLVETAVKLGCSERLYFTGYVPDDDVPVLYRDADVYIEMSHYEGFGLQVCEAMATGTAVIASNVASLPEVVGNGGYLVPLEDVTMLADKLLTLLTDSDKAKELSQLAQKQAAKFSWDKCAKVSWRVIQEVLRNTQYVTNK